MTCEASGFKKTAWPSGTLDRNRGGCACKWRNYWLTLAGPGRFRGPKQAVSFMSVMVDARGV